jgi:peptidoglycan/LPS O-acetylase OafA/YrhL
MKFSAPKHADYVATKYFPSLDGLRAISILSVIWYHVPELRPMWRTGYLGVHLFFVISGFLITTLLLREKARTGRISLRDFYIRRTLRIFPAYYLTLALYLIACLIMPEFRTSALPNYVHNLPSFLTYSSNWFVNPWAPGLVVFVPAWSLATEEQFYLFWPAIVAISRSVRVPILVMSLLIVGNEAVKAVVGYQFFLADQPLALVILNSVSTAICLGCLLAIALDNKRAFALAARVLGRPWSAPLFVGLMLVASVVPNSDSLEVGRMLAIVVTMTLAVGSVTIRKKSSLSPLFTNAPIRYIGMVSYGLYLYHSFGLNIADRYIGPLKSYPVLYFAAIVAIDMLLASLSYYIFERRFLDLKEKLTRRRSQKPDEPVLQPAA